MFFNSLIIVLLITSDLYAQKSFAPATMLLTNGDTLEGYINLQSDKLAPHTIQFSKDNLGIGSKSYSPLEVKWFKFYQGDWYWGFNGKIESSSLNQNELTLDSAMHQVNDTFFVRLILLSSASLFYARDEKERMHLFFQMGNEKITELVYKKYIAARNANADIKNAGAADIIGNEIYKGQLIKAFSDCPIVSSEILSQKIEYNKTDLIKVFEEYNRCKSTPIMYEEITDRGKLIFSITGGINFVYLKVTANYGNPYMIENFASPFGYQLGFGINYIIPRTKNKIALYNDVMFKSMSLFGFAGVNNEIKYTTNQKQIKIATMFRYHFPSKKINPYLGLGLSYGFMLKYDFTSDNGLLSPNAQAYRVGEQGINFGYGINRKNINAELRGEISNGWSPYSDVRTSVKTLYVLIGYTF